MASSATVSAPKKRKSFSEYFHSMRGQQLIVTLVFLFVPLALGDTAVMRPAALRV